jgi:sorting nexin-1/2
VISPVVSPLERPPASSNIDRSFAGLSLGAESIGGWQADQGSWANEYQSTSSVSNVGSAAEDDDDDDEPILKSLRSGTDPSNPVSSL